MPVRISAGKNWPKTKAWLQKMQKGDLFSTLEKYGEMGVAALSSATPVDGGESAASWDYAIEQKGAGFIIKWTNSHRVGNTPLVIMLQHGHGTGTGGYVQGRDFINPAIQPIFDQIEAEIERMVSR